MRTDTTRESPTPFAGDPSTHPPSGAVRTEEARVRGDDELRLLRAFRQMSEPFKKNFLDSAEKTAGMYFHREDRPGEEVETCI